LAFIICHSDCVIKLQNQKSGKQKIVLHQFLLAVITCQPLRFAVTFL